MAQTHVIFGTGPVGCWTVRALMEENLPVRAVNRSGLRPALLPGQVELICADVMEPALAVPSGACVVYQAMNAPYHRWEELFPTLQANSLEAAKTAGAKFVSIENLYMYDSSCTITENSPVKPVSRKGALRGKLAAEIQAAHNRGEIQAAALRSSDTYGPVVTDSALGERLFGFLVKGKKAQLYGSAEMPHFAAYIEDVGRAAAVLGTHDSVFGEVWLAPHAAPMTQGEIARLASQHLEENPKYSVISPLMMRLAGLFNPAARASVEMMYQFTEPFAADSSKIVRKFNLTPTPMDERIMRTMEWYRSQNA